RARDLQPGSVTVEINAIYQARSGGKCKCGDGIAGPTEQCDGGGCCTTSCTFVPSGTLCRPSAGVCDLTETCTGASGSCPADAKRTAVCRPAGGTCDVAETCDGGGNDCRPDAVGPSGPVCRASRGR